MLINLSQRLLIVLAQFNLHPHVLWRVRRLHSFHVQIAPCLFLLDGRIPAVGQRTWRSVAQTRHIVLVLTKCLLAGIDFEAALLLENLKHAPGLLLSRWSMRSTSVLSLWAAVHSVRPSQDTHIRIPSQIDPLQDCALLQLFLPTGGSKIKGWIGRVSIEWSRPSDCCDPTSQSKASCCILLVVKFISQINQPPVRTEQLTLSPNTSKLQN